MKEPGSMTVDIPKVLAAMLWAAIEDYHGLWDYPGEVLGVLPGENYASAVTIARAALTTCVVDGLVELLWSEEPDGPTERIPTHEARHLLQESQYWEPVVSGRAIVVNATSLGEEVYKRLYQASASEGVRRG